VATKRERAELKKLAARVDRLAVHRDRTPYVMWHQKLHRRIAECTRCPALSATIEQTNVLASIWFCVARRPSPSDTTRRHRDLLDALCAGDADRAAEAMREHISAGLKHTRELLEPYFRLRTANGRTFVRSKRKQRLLAVGGSLSPGASNRDMRG
jgi:DNA-binding GntR family transcriptional regulator